MHTAHIQGWSGGSWHLYGNLLNEQLLTWRAQALRRADHSGGPPGPRAPRQATSLSPREGASHIPYGATARRGDGGHLGTEWIYPLLNERSQQER